MSLPDSGKRRHFDTGSQRDDATGKGRFDLLPPFVEERHAVHMERGAVKYEERNWEKGQALSVYLSSMRRHLCKWLMGMTDEDHLAAALWNLSCLIDTQERCKRDLLPPELNDLPVDYAAMAPRPPVVGSATLATEYSNACPCSDCELARHEERTSSSSDAGFPKSAHTRSPLLSPTRSGAASTAASRTTSSPDDGLKGDIPS